MTYQIESRHLLHSARDLIVGTLLHLPTCSAGRNVMTSKKIRVCPRCGSQRIHAAKSAVSGWLVPDTYYCDDCKYSGPVYVEIEADDAEQLRKVINGESSEH